MAVVPSPSHTLLPQIADCISEACLEQSSCDAKAIVKSFISCRILQVFIASFPGHLWGTWERGYLDYKHHHTSFSKPVGNLYMAQVSLSSVHTHSSLQIVDCISEALCIVETPLPMKIARLYLTNTHTHAHTRSCRLLHAISKRYNSNYRPPSSRASFPDPE